MRIYNPGLGKFLSVDPLRKNYPWYTPYQFAGNTPIQATDLDGAEEYHYSLSFDKDGKPILTFLYTENWTLVCMFGEDEYNPNFKFVVHTGVTYTAAINERVWDEEIVFNYYDPDDFIAAKTAITPQDIQDKIKSNRFWNTVAAGFQNVGDEIRSNGVGGGRSPRRPSNNTPASNRRARTAPNKKITLKDNSPQENLPKFKPTINKGKLNIPGRTTTTTNMDFVITNDGQLHIGQGHYSLSGNANSVLAAGQLKISNGTVKLINNSSGHYQPTIQQGMQAIKYLNNLGVDTSKSHIIMYNSQGKQELHITPKKE
ncbi:MAG: hypothetical protein M0D57_00130 [Sphingobacteriales bacterium JAD_PAG50586_3]|nr:MAG: hypothetical protein M0D57_00130 [Sphingobacteriales bacterium JAD_PAG50586_3]